MVKASVVVIAGILIYLGVGQSLWKTKKKKEWILFSCLLLMGVLLNVGVVLDIPIPTPADGISKLLEPFTKPIYTWIMSGNS